MTCTSRISSPAAQLLLRCYPTAARAIATLEQRIGYTFTSQDLLIEALTHRSAIMELTHLCDTMEQQLLKTCPWNERLEFLGDSVLSLSMVTWLWYKGELASEGELSKAKSALVQATVLAMVARQLDLAPCLILGEATARAGGRGGESMLGDALEALIGAIYLDGGFETCYFFIESAFGPLIKQHLHQQAFVDHKTELQELVQQRFGCLPDYTVVSAWGPDHQKHFVVECRLKTRLLGRGTGPSKKKASQLAAAEALKELSS